MLGYSVRRGSFPRLAFQTCYVSEWGLPRGSGKQTAEAGDQRVKGDKQWREERHIRHRESAREKEEGAEGYK